MTNARSFRPPPVTVAGEPLSSQQIADIQETVELFPADSRLELAQTICEHLQLFTLTGCRPVWPFSRNLSDRGC